jgi:hypothetical protein
MKFASIAIGILAFLLTANIAQAQLMDLGFHRITSTNQENIENQLGAQVRDQDQALTDFNESINANEVLFTFTNNAAVNSNIAEIYFDDGTIFSQTRIKNSLDGFTNYSDGGKNGINPPNLPGGNTIAPNPFVKTADFGADTQGNPNNGANASNDIVGIVIQLLSGKNFSELQDSLTNGVLRLGLHVRSIGNASLSDSFVNNPFGGGPAAIETPIPAAMWLFGPALLALTGVIRRRNPHKLS